MNEIQKRNLKYQLLYITYKTFLQIFNNIQKKNNKNGSNNTVISYYQIINITIKLCNIA